MKIRTSRENKYESASELNSTLSTNDKRVIHTTKAGHTCSFIAFETCINHSDPNACVTKYTSRERRYRLLKKRSANLTNFPQLTELEYLESSGTQYIDTGYIPNNETGLRHTLLTWPDVDTIPFGCRNSATTETRLYAPRPRIVPAENAIYRGFGWGTWLGQQFSNSLRDKPWYGWLNWLNCREARVEIDTAEFINSLKVLTFEPEFSVYLFTANIAGISSNQYAGKITAAAISQGEKIVHDFVPVLNEDGEPGMWDKVSKRFFGNDGTGTFGYALKGQGESSTYSLRNPGVVPPSGIYARKSGETSLEILADTEKTSGEGWEWFANTAEAYEHFGIVPEGEEFLTE